MPLNSIRGAIGDTSFWIAAFDPRVEHHERSVALLDALRATVILMPWPLTYEVLRTRTVKSPGMSRAFQQIIRSPKLIRIDDSDYRMRCLEATLEGAASGQRAISLVDMVVRAVLSDSKYHISRLLTFNPGDFVDVSQARRIAIWPN